MKIFPNLKGMLKCDDDIIPNIKRINELLLFFSSNHINYFGRKIVINKNELSNCHFNKCSNDSFNIKKLVYKSAYAAGPLYYLSSKSMNMLLNHYMNYNKYFYEDNMVGYILNKYNIFPVNYQIYSDDMNDNCIIQNHTNNKKIFILLHGGLGNQLFQVSAAYQLAKKTNRFLILLIKKNLSNMTHTKNEDEFMTTIFSKFNYTYYENIDISKLCVYKEAKCFDYDSSMITENKDYILHGYFQHKNYICDIFNVDGYHFNDIDNSYFIHIRRGDYLNCSMYDFDKDTYYTKAINYVLDKDKDAHFYIMSDDIEYVKTYDILKNINKTIVDDMNTLDSLYFMSMCKKGGICANSTFSGWATVLNKNADKIVIFPKQWINVDYDYEIPFNYTVLL
jgi:hypothetical protein